MQFSKAKPIFPEIGSMIYCSHGYLIRALCLMTASAWRGLPRSCICMLFVSHNNIYYPYISNACNFIRLCSLKHQHVILFTMKGEAWEETGRGCEAKSRGSADAPTSIFLKHHPRGAASCKDHADVAVSVPPAHKRVEIKFSSEILIL